MRFGAHGHIEHSCGPVNEAPDTRQNELERLFEEPRQGEILPEDPGPEVPEDATPASDAVVEHGEAGACHLESSYACSCLFRGEKTDLGSRGPFYRKYSENNSPKAP